jgi:hypothetical protein
MRMGPLVAVACLAACRTMNPFVLSGDRAMAEGRFDQAVADYRVALSSTAPRSLYREEIEERFERAAEALARREIERALALPPEDAQRRLAQIADRGAWGSSDGKAQALRALGPVTGVRWGEVDALVAQGQSARALALALDLAAPFPKEHEMQERVEELRRALAARHRQIASGAPPLAAAFHQRLAARWASPSASTDAFATPRRNWSVAAAGVACPWLREALTSQDDDADAQIIVEITKCESSEEESTERKEYSYEKPVRRVVVVEQPVYELLFDPGCAERCSRFDAFGSCIDRSGCAPPKRIPKTRRVPRIVYETRTATASHLVHRRTARVLVDVLVRARDFEISLPVAFDRALTDEAYWTPEENKLPERIDREALEREARSSLASAIVSMKRNVVWRETQVLVDEADDLRRSGPLEAEERYLAASIARSYVPQQAEEHFVLRYGLTRRDVKAVLEGKRLRSSTPPRLELELPLPTRSSWTTMRALDPVVSFTSAQGIELLLESTVELAYFVRRPPVDASLLASGLALRVRLGRFHLGAEGLPAQLGRSVAGFAMGASSLFGDRDTFSYLVRVGAAYRREEADDRSRFEQLSIPLTLYLPISRYIVGDFEVRPNLLRLEDASISAGITADLGQLFYIGARATHYVGRSPIVHLGGEIGARM